MQAVLALFMGFVLLVISFYLLKKPTVFFTLIPQNQINLRFLQCYGVIYGLLAFLSFSFVFFDNLAFFLLFIAATMVVAASFSISFAFHMKN
ncbi:MAG: hypothetical protein ACK5MW_01490 [Enterococcus sp.]